MLLLQKAHLDLPVLVFSALLVLLRFWSVRFLSCMLGCEHASFFSFIPDPVGVFFAPDASCWLINSVPFYCCHLCVNWCLWKKTVAEWFKSPWWRPCAETCGWNKKILPVSQLVLLSCCLAFGPLLLEHLVGWWSSDSTLLLHVNWCLTVRTLAWRISILNSIHAVQTFSCL